MAARLADGLPARRDTRSRRLRRVPDPRPVGDRHPHRGPRRASVPERVPPPWCPRRPGPGLAPRRLRVPLPRLVLCPRWAQHASDPAGRVLRAQSRGGRPRPDTGAMRGVGRVRVDQSRRRRSAASGVRRAHRERAGCVEGGVTAGRVVVLMPPARQLEAGPGGLRRAVPRAAGTSPTPDPRALSRSQASRLRSSLVCRRRARVPADDERGHGRDGARP